MTGRTRRASGIRAAHARRCLWQPAAVILFAIAAVLCCRIGDQPALAAGPDPTKLVGRWVRTDGGYVLALENPVFDGRLTAAYFNPRPINVARAAWILEDGRLIVLVELRDEGYPGSIYKLVYQPDTDRLAGIYFQATLRQQFDVVFERSKTQE